MQAPPPSKIVVRLRSKDALERIDADRNWTVSELKKAIAQKTGVPVPDQKLARDAKFTVGLSDAERLTHWENGAMLFYDYTTTRTNLPETTRPPSPKRWTLSSYMQNLEAQGLIFAPQKEPHCKECSLDFDAANTFQMYVQQLGFQRQRAGYCYGRYTDAGGVFIEVIYEPPQENGPTHFKILDDEEEVQRADVIATLLGLEKVGFVFSHNKREFLFSAEEVMKVVSLQAEALSRNPERGKAFCTLKLTVTDEGQSQLESFQVSDQAVKLHTKQLLAPPNPEEPQFVRTKEKVLITTAKGGRQDTDKLDTDVLLVRVPLNPAKGSLRTAFPIENRPEMPITTDQFRKYRVQWKDKPWVQQISDFHFLLYISRFLDMKSDLPALCEAVKTQQPGHSDNFRYLIDSYAGLT